jgi:hypothetical protein
MTASSDDIITGLPQDVARPARRYLKLALESV